MESSMYTESILDSVKKLLGIGEDYGPFDHDIVMHINSVFMVLNQIGVGPKEVFTITGPDETWADFLTLGDTSLPIVKSYVYLRVRLLFDPPLSSSVADAMNRQVSEFEWRLNAAADPAYRKEVSYG